jgi:4-hydroxybenzoate polyprenyltransferase
MRPANIVTAVSDILAGAAMSGIIAYSSRLYITDVLLLVLSTIGLYGGGVVFNDVFDADLDRVERPERPIPSGKVSEMSATWFGSALWVIGIFAAFLVNYTASIIALCIAVASLVYDRWAKHHLFFGPLNMGLCRGLNLMLGVSILPGLLNVYWSLSFIPILYIAAITMISRGEVHGGRKHVLYAAGFLYVLVIVSIVYISLLRETWLYTLFYVAIFSAMIFPPLSKAINEPIGKNIGGAVKAGVLALIAMNAAWAAAFGTMTFALLILLLLPLSLLLAKAFSVT